MMILPRSWCVHRMGNVSHDGCNRYSNFYASRTVFRQLTDSPTWWKICGWSMAICHRIILEQWVDEDSSIANVPPNQMYPLGYSGRGHTSVLARALFNIQPTPECAITWLWKHVPSLWVGHTCQTWWTSHIQVDDSSWVVSNRHIGVIANPGSPDFIPNHSLWPLKSHLQIAPNFDTWTLVRIAVGIQASRPPPTPRPATGASRALRARSVPECPQECPRKQEVSERVSGRGVSRALRTPESGVSKKCPESVPGCQKGVHDTPGTLSGHFLGHSGARDPKAPGDTLSDTLSDPPPFSGTLLGTLQGHFGPSLAREATVAGLGGNPSTETVQDICISDRVHAVSQRWWSEIGDANRIPKPQWDAIS